jgi:hypothetical protein
VTSANSVIGHAAVNEVLSVAAANAATPDQVAFYSSHGPGSISFPAAETRSVPNITGIDCVSTEVGALGFFFTPFCGTSAAAPHVAGIAALLIERNPSLASGALRRAITGNAVILPSAFDPASGFGRADALAAAQAVPPLFTLSVVRAGVGSGRVTSVPAGIACGPTCKARFLGGMQVTLTAVPNTVMQSTFVGWSGCGAIGPDPKTCTVTLNASTTITATFDAPTFILTVARAGSGSGTVTSAPDGIACGATCAAPFAINRMVTLTAVADPASRFVGWSGSCTGTLPCTVTMTKAKTVTATFKLRPLTLTVVRSGTGGGTVTSNPVGIACPPTCSAPFPVNAQVTLTARHNATSTFDGWTDVCAGAGPTCTFTISSTTSVTAVFTRLPSARVRFFNNTTFKAQPWTATLVSDQGYTWSSPTGVFSGYQRVFTSALGGFLMTLPNNFTLRFDGTFSLTFDRNYVIAFTVTSTHQPVLILFDEGATSAAPSAPVRVQSAIARPAAPLGDSLKAIPPDRSPFPLEPR